MVVRNDRDHHGWEFREAGFRLLRSRKRRFAGAKVAAAPQNLLDTFARSDGEVSELTGRVSFIVLGRPSAVERSGNAGARADQNNRILGIGDGAVRPENKNPQQTNTREKTAARTPRPNAWCRKCCRYLHRVPPNCSGAMSNGPFLLATGILTEVRRCTGKFHF